MKSKTKRYEITALAYDKRGRLLAVGKNSYIRTHPLQAKYGAMVGKPKSIYIHAELDALIKARARVYKLVVMRFDKNHKPQLAAPCESCQLAIRDFKVKHVEHTRRSS
jgi:deoxycytidylate deaminase